MRTISPGVLLRAPWELKFAKARRRFAGWSLRPHLNSDEQLLIIRNDAVNLLFENGFDTSDNPLSIPRMSVYDR